MNYQALRESIISSVSPKSKGRCPECGASFEALDEMLHESKYSDNFQMAVSFIEKCPGCKKQFCREMGK